MSQVCAVCGKRPSVGNTVARRGRAKHLGGVGRKITGISKRRFRPNLQRVRAVQGGSVKRIRVCTKCLRSGKVTKPTARPKFDADGKILPVQAPAFTQPPAPEPEPEAVEVAVDELDEDLDELEATDDESVEERVEDEPDEQ